MYRARVHGWLDRYLGGVAETPHRTRRRSELPKTFDPAEIGRWYAHWKARGVCPDRPRPSRHDRIPPERRSPTSPRPAIPSGHLSATLEQGKDSRGSSAGSRIATHMVAAAAQRRQQSLDFTRDDSSTRLAVDGGKRRQITLHLRRLGSSLRLANSVHEEKLQPRGGLVFVGSTIAACFIATNGW